VRAFKTLFQNEKKIFALKSRYRNKSDDSIVTWLCLATINIACFYYGLNAVETHYDKQVFLHDVHMNFIWIGLPKKGC
jgi:hypothetical protein